MLSRRAGKAGPRHDILPDKWIWAGSTAWGRFWCTSVWHTLSDGGRGELGVADILGTDDGCEACKSQFGAQPALCVSAHCMEVAVYDF